jgi:hypothetical protein
MRQPQLDEGHMRFDLAAIALMQGAMRYLTAMAAVAAVLHPNAAQAQAPEGGFAAFSEDVKATTGDWTVRAGFVGDGYERDGNLLLHPDSFTDLSPITMRLLPEEPALGRTAESVLRFHFDPMEIEGKAVDFSVIETITDRAIGVGHQWLEYNDDRYFGLWGVITTPQGNFVPYALKCRRNHQQYSFEQCLQAGSRVMAAVGVGRLTMPEPRIPLVISGHSASYGNDGFVTLTKSNYNRTVNAVIRISPPVAIEPAQMGAVLKNFSNTMLDEFDGEKEDIAAMRFVGSTEEPWIRREFGGVYGANVKMAGLVKIPDGRFSIVTVDCPNPSWQSACAFGVERTKMFITTGIAERRRVALVERANTPLPANGLNTSDVVAVYSAANVNGTTVTQNFAVLLKDGRAYANDSLAPQMIDATAPPQELDPDWGRWTRRGSSILVTWDDGDSDEFSNQTATTKWSGGTKATRLSGYFGNVIVSGGGFSGGVVNRSGYTLNADGTFQSSNSSSFSVSAYLPNGNAGLTQVASGASSNQGARARYEVDGYMVTFYHPDGRVERRSFAVPADEAGSASPSQIMIGGSVLRRDFR